MTAKSAITQLGEEDIKTILWDNFPPLKDVTFQITFHLLDGGIINLVYCVEIEGELPKDIPHKVVLKVVKK